MRKVSSLIVISILVIVVLLGVIRADDKKKETYIAKDVLILEIKEGLEESNLPEEEKAKYCDSIPPYLPRDLKVDTKGNIYLLYSNSCKGIAHENCYIFDYDKNEWIKLEPKPYNKILHFIRKYNKDGEYIKTIFWEGRNNNDNKKYYDDNYIFLVDEDESIYIMHEDELIIDKYDSNKGNFVKRFSLGKKPTTKGWRIEVDNGGIYEGGKLLSSLDKKGLSDRKFNEVKVDRDKYIVKGLKSIGGLVDELPLEYGKKYKNNCLGLIKIDKNNNLYTVWNDIDPKNLGKGNILPIFGGPKFLEYYLVKYNNKMEIIAEFKLKGAPGSFYVDSNGTVYHGVQRLKEGYIITKYEKQK